MKIFLVRHGKVVKRASWSKADELRPLKPSGARQAQGIRALLADVPIRRVCSSPAIRCRETVEPLAEDHSLSVEVDPRLSVDPGRVVDVWAALDLIEEKAGDPVVLCTSRSLIVELLGALGVGGEEVGSLRCQKGSVWVLERRRGEIVRAEYHAPREGTSGERRAVLDLGSTSMSLLVADVGPGKGRLQPIHRERAELRLGASPDQIGAADCDQIVRLGRSMRAAARKAGSGEMISVATASLRNAANGAEVAERVTEVLEVPLRILSGLDEARIVYQAVRRRLDLDEQPTLVVDLGGGSLDLALGRRDEILNAASEPLGVTRLHAECVQHDPMKRSEFDAIRDRVRSGIEPHRERIGQLGIVRCVIAGGTGRAVAKLVQERRGEAVNPVVPGVRILRAELDSLAKLLRRATHAERIEMASMPAQRADLLPTGAIILASLLEILDLPELLVCDWGLREGVLLEGATRHPEP